MGELEAPKYYMVAYEDIYLVIILTVETKDLMVLMNFTQFLPWYQGWM